MQILKKYINKIKKSNSALKDVSSVAGGTVIAQVIGILLMPVISRIYSPADYGIVAVFASAITILSVISGLGYFYAIPLPKLDRHANAVIILTISIQCIFTILLTLALFTMSINIFVKIGLKDLYKYKMLLPPAVFFIGLYNTFTQWGIRSKSFYAIGKTKVLQSITGNITKIFLGICSVRPMGLILGDIISRASGTATLYKGIVSVKGIPKTTSQDIRRVAIRYRNFPLFDVWSNLLNTAGYHLVPYMIMIFYDSHTTGSFSMAFTLMAIPSAVIGTAIGQVFYQRAASAHHSGMISDVTSKAYITLLRFSLFPILLLSILSPLIFSIVLGNMWRDAGVYSLLLGPWVMIMFIQSPLSNVFSILGIQKHALVIEIFYSVSRISAFLLGTLWKDPRVAIFFLSAAGFMVTVFRLWFVLISSGNKTSYILKISLPVIIESLVLLFVPFLIYLIGFKQPFFLILASVFACFIYIYRNIKP